MIEMNINVPSRPSTLEPRDRQLWVAAMKLESSFLAEMLKSAGLGEMPSDFGGGAGEEQFQSLMLHAQAEQMVKRGGVGLTQSIFESLKERDNGTV